MSIGSDPLNIDEEINFYLNVAEHYPELFSIEDMANIARFRVAQEVAKIDDPYEDAKQLQVYYKLAETSKLLEERVSEKNAATFKR